MIVLSGNACPMIDGVAQSNVRGVAHDYDMRLAATFRHGRYARQCSLAGGRASDMVSQQSIMTGQILRGASDRVIKSQILVMFR